MRRSHETGVSRALLVATLLVLCARPLCVLAADCNGNGVEDLEDLRAGTNADCNLNGNPDECEIATGSVQISELATVPTGGRVSVSAAAADLDGDGDVDVAALLSGNLGILRGDGSGDFELADFYPAYGSGLGLLAADLDGNSAPDAVVSFEGEPPLLVTYLAAEPFEACGPDPSPDSLGCEWFAPCAR